MEKFMGNYILNFVIGFFASLCAVFVPRMMAMLSNSNGSLQYISPDYLLVGLIFSLVIGAVTVIFQQGRQKSAAEIFMTALGIPALLAGTLNSGTVGHNLNELQSDNKKLLSSLAQQNSISIEDKSTNITPLETIKPDTPPLSGLNASLISDAQAADALPATGLKLGIQVEEKPYLIVLGKAKNKADAIQQAAELRKILPKAMAVQSNQDFLVIDGEQPKNKSDALLKAIEIQNKTGLRPYLLQSK